MCYSQIQLQHLLRPSSDYCPILTVRLSCQDAHAGQQKLTIGRRSLLSSAMSLPIWPKGVLKSAVVSPWRRMPLRIARAAMIVDSKRTIPEGKNNIVNHQRIGGPSMWVIGACVLALAGSPLLVARQNHPGGESEDGKRLFIANCAPCHGPDGDAIAGIDFGHGKFRRASSDQDVLEIVRGGIPGSVMPGFSNELSEVEIKRLAGYLHYLAEAAQSTSAPGDAPRGKIIFEGNGKCLEC